MFGRRSHGRSQMGVLLLIFQLFQIGMDRIPPTTLATVALNVIIHLMYIPDFTWQSVCISVREVWYARDYSRLLKGAFFHGDDWHLYFNMISFLYKGLYLERIVGSAWFLYMIGVFTICTNLILLYLNYALAYLLSDMSYLHQCAIGFSGVVFAVKVVTTYMAPTGTERLMGFIPVNSRYACWFELVLIQLIVPNASFTGHLAGILVGLAYVKGPLKWIMELPVSPFRMISNRSRQPTYRYHSGTTRGADDNDYDRYTGGMDESEQIRKAMEESMRTGHNRIYPDLDGPGYVHPTAPPDHFESTAPPYGWNIQSEDSHQEELRRRRLARFDR
ncbi:rhomboid-related protein 4-like [Styela clava]|uniref:rhomboid-related protein 4-like n=1 Tax=Styela clava TaxID=7725 RepID=UPI00193AD1AA|nr:rhomboid-related protein 4-like [Styela clava]